MAPPPPPTRPPSRPRRAPPLRAEFDLREDPAAPGGLLLRHEAAISDPEVGAAVASGEARVVLRVRCPATHFSRADEAPLSGETRLGRSDLLGAIEAEILVAGRAHGSAGGTPFEPGSVLAEGARARLPDPAGDAGSEPRGAPGPDLVREMHDSVERNLERYARGDFAGVGLPASPPEIPGGRVLVENLRRLHAGAKGAKDSSDAENAALVFEALPGLTPRLARSEGLWVWLCHGPCLDYARRRWIKPNAPEADVAEAARAHFFARKEDGVRAFTRKNAVACLWWWARIASRHPRADLRRSLSILLSKADIRSSVIERPGISSDARVFTALMDVLLPRHEADSTEGFFTRSGGDAPYRAWSRALVRAEKERPLDLLPDADLRALLERLADEAAAGP